MRPTVRAEPVPAAGGLSRWVLWPVGAGALLVGAGVAGAVGGGVAEWEQRVFRAVNGLPEFLFRPMWALQIAGVLGAPLLLAAVALVVRRWRLAAALILFVPLKLLVERRVLKQYVPRGRPGETEPVAVLRGVPEIGLSFPSGHAIVAVGMATLVAPYVGRRWQVAAFAVACLVCVARVYLGAHNPLDVVAGAGAGLVLGGLLHLVVGTFRSRSASSPRG